MERVNYTNKKGNHGNQKNGSNTELFQKIKNAMPEKITPCKLMELIIRQEMSRGRNFNRFYSPGIKHWNNFQTL